MDHRRIREYSITQRNKRRYASEEQQRQIMNQILWPTKADIDWVEETFAIHKDETPEQWRDRLLYKEGLAAEFQAIYGLRWQECAEFSENRYQYWGPGWILQGFHNSPIGARLWIEWPENDAVKALLYSKRGKIPPFSTGLEPYINIIPYSFADWNIDNGVRWYRRIEDNLRRAGADVTMYFETPHNTYDFGGGPYFVNNEFRVTRWD